MRPTTTTTTTTTTITITVSLAAGFALALAACGDDDDGDLLPGDATAFAVATDYASTGIASTVAIPGLQVNQNAIAGIASTDPMVRLHGDRIYLVNRFGADNVTILDARAGTLIDQISTGSGSNPQDIAVAGDTLYVAALAAPGVLVLDASAPSAGVVDTIDLSALDPDDGIPNCSTLHLVGELLVVVCGVLDDNDQFLTPRGPGKVAVIDTRTATVEDVFELTHQRPLGLLQATAEDGDLGGDLLVATAPDFVDLTQGCIERISRAGEPRGCAVANADLGGYASAYRHHQGTLFIAVTTGFDSADFGPTGKVMTWSAGALGGDMTPPGQRAFDVATCPTGHLVLADAGGGLRVYDPSGAELTANPLDIGMPPVPNGIVCY
jgi:hypothetical protein